MKPILIDTLHVHMSGALAIVNHLVDNFVAQNVGFVLIKDSRAPRFHAEDRVKHLVVMPCSEWERMCYYRLHRNDYHSVLCMANIPPAIKMPCKVYTYFHNVTLLEMPKTFPFKARLSFFMKYIIIRLLQSHSNYWIVQTEHTKNLINKNFPPKETYVYPIYKIPEELKCYSHEERCDYVFIGEYTGAKGHDKLLKAWEILSKLGLNKKLHLTVNYPPYQQLINEYKSRGVNIENHGFVSFNEVVKLYHSSKAIVYPSLNESLGLGLIEAVEAGCDIIGADLPYTHAVCEPSVLFNPANPQSIADAVMRYEQDNTKCTKLTICDMIDNLINMVTS